MGMSVGMVCGVAGLMLPVMALAQPPHGGPGGPGGGPGGAVRFAGDMRVVKGQPYSAEVTTETVQVLGDGTRIIKKTTGLVYRDGEGRTRRETSPTGAGGVTTVAIFDPVAGISWTLNPSSKSATKSAFHAPEAGRGPGREMRNPGGGPPPPPPGVAGERGGGGGRNRAHNAVVADLGSMTAEGGLTLTGKRTTSTIPAGEMGNDREIKIVDEVWFSPDLRVVVQSKHSDPWTGDVTYKLTNLKRAEPAHSLFEAPADFQVIERNPHGPGGGGGVGDARQH